MNAKGNSDENSSVDWQLDHINGVISVIKCKSWNGFIDLLHNENALKRNHGYFYRGQASENWKLEPTLKRNVKSKNLENIKTKTLSTFKKHCLGRRGHNPANLNENEWWAVGQHFGLNTPLLDWTESPYVAAFFAFNNVIDNKGNVVVWLLSKGINKTPCIEKLRKDKQLEFVFPYIDENSRLINQRGLFVKSPDMVCIEQWAKDIKDTGTIGLAKILIPKSERQFALDSLDKMNINEFTLFPDLSGAGMYSNYIIQRDEVET